MSPDACDLQLPDSMRIHPVQNVSLLDQVAVDSLDGQVALPPPLVEVEGIQEYQVEQIEDSQI